MEIAVETTNLTNKLNVLVQPTDELFVFSSLAFDGNDIIDVSQISFQDDESWLLESNHKSSSDLQNWLYNSDCLSENGILAHSSNLPKCRRSDLPKNIDTRTFTRPKKRFIRPSLEKYNEELWGNDRTPPSLNISSDSTSVKLDDSIMELNAKPIHFDLTQPANHYLFDNILANAPMTDSFQNMSPPSLVNSMCSSTFTNLMENSFIKNDPALREIRDSDYTEAILEFETAPFFQSITESCCSSDTTEGFLTKAPCNETFKNEIINATFQKEGLETFVHEDTEEKIKQTVNKLNGTYQRMPKTKRTFKESDVNGTIDMNSTFQRRKVDQIGYNSTNTLATQKFGFTSGHHEISMHEVHNSKILESTKRLLDRRPSPSVDLNRLSYLVNEQDQMFSNINSVGSADSTENLDFMSASSGSTKSSDGMIKLNCLVDKQERALHQVMSTPKPNMRTRILWENNIISPISNSDPELSSSEPTETQSIISNNSLAKQRSLGNIYIRQLPLKSNNIKTKPKSVKTTTGGSDPSLKHPELQPQTSIFVNNCKSNGSPTNLNSMGQRLKGSYTSLKPMNRNLPVVTPLDTTMTLPKTRAVAVNVAQVPPIPRDSKKIHDAQFLKPQLSRVSGLPRPITNISRPVSRIPGPRNVARTLIRPIGLQGMQFNH